MVPSEATRGVVGVGYEGLDLPSFINTLAQAGVDVLADVRLTPISRKPGFSKRALATALTEAGIAYLHLRSLGNPKANRGGFGGTASELRTARKRYARLLHDAAAEEALDEIARLGNSALVAVMCFEADERRCHRDVVLKAVQQRLRHGIPPVRRQGVGKVVCAG